MKTQSLIQRSAGASHGREFLFGLLLPAAVAAVMFSAAPAHAQAYVNVTVGGAIAPGVYGQISLGNNNPPPPVINAQPVLVGTPVYGAPVMYVYAPPEHVRDWARHCGYYHACGRPVHFVELREQNRWWDKHNEHLRGRGYYREEERRHEGRGHDERRQDEGRGDERHDRR